MWARASTSCTVALSLAFRCPPISLQLWHHHTTKRHFHVDFQFIPPTLKIVYKRSGFKGTPNYFPDSQKLEPWKSIEPNALEDQPKSQPQLRSTLSVPSVNHEQLIGIISFCRGLLSPASLSLLPGNPLIAVCQTGLK